MKKSRPTAPRPPNKPKALPPSTACSKPAATNSSNSSLSGPGYPEEDSPHFEMIDEQAPYASEAKR
jgi:hypothetical protein